MPPCHGGGRGFESRQGRLPEVTADDLVVSILDVRTRDWTWTANIPGFGLLSDDFPDPHLWISTVHDGVVSLPPAEPLTSSPPEPGWRRSTPTSC